MTLHEKPNAEKVNYLLFKLALKPDVSLTLTNTLVQLVKLTSKYINALVGYYDVGWLPWEKNHDLA